MDEQIEQLLKENSLEDIIEQTESQLIRHVRYCATKEKHL